jgi:hypothetical protein
METAKHGDILKKCRLFKSFSLFLQTKQQQKTTIAKNTRQTQLSHIQQAR